MVENIQNIPNSINSANTDTLVTLDKLNYNKLTQRNLDYLKYNFLDVARDIYIRNSMGEEILTFFPDLKIAAQIIVSSVISPNDTLNTSITYDIENLNIKNTLSATITDCVKRYIDSVYKLENNLYTYLKDALFTKGCYVECIIPEASVSALINGTNLDNLNNENLDYYIKSMKYDTFKLNTEDLPTYSPRLFKNLNLKNTKIINKEIVINTEALGIDVTTDTSILFNNLKQYKKSKIFGKCNVKRKIINSNIEDDTKHYLDILFKDNSNFKDEYIQYVKSYDETPRKSFDVPLILKVNPESIIPIYGNNTPSEHIGYFLILDGEGNPLNLANEILEYNAMLSIDKSNNTELSQNILEKAYHNINGIEKPHVLLKDIETLYSDILDHLIKQKLRTGDINNIGKLKDTTDLFRVMLSRSFKAKKTRLLYLPYENVQYYAFNFRKNGTGQSLIEQVSPLLAMAATIVIANVNANIENAIPKRKIKVELDEADQSPEEAAEIVREGILRTQKITKTFGMFSIKDLTEWLTIAGYTIDIKHPDMPNMEIDTETVAETLAVIDQTVYEDLMKRVYKTLGITQDMVESGFEANFAAEIATHNVLFARRIIETQNDFEPMITEHVQKLIYNDPILQSNIKDIIKDNLNDLKTIIDEIEFKNSNKEISDEIIIEYLYETICENLRINLPKPIVENQIGLYEKFEKYVQNLDTVLDARFNEDLYPDAIYKDTKELIQMQKGMFKASAITNWCVEQNFIPEISNWWIKDENDIMNLDIVGDNINSYMKTLTHTMDELTKYLPFIHKAIKTHVKFKEVLDTVGSSEYKQESEEENNDTNNNDNNDVSNANGDSTDNGTDDKSTDENQLDKDIENENDTEVADDETLEDDTGLEEEVK